jgi:hypothetical protein
MNRFPFAASSFLQNCIQYKKHFSVAITAIPNGETKWLKIRLKAQIKNAILSNVVKTQRNDAQ